MFMLFFALDSGARHLLPNKPPY